MSRRYWVPSAPIGTGIILVLTVLFVGLANDDKYAGTPETPPGHEQPIAPPDVTGTQPEPSRDEQRAEEDLRAQKEMADWALGMLIATAIGVILLGATLNETRKAGIAASDILDETRRQSEAAVKSVEIARATYLLAYCVVYKSLASADPTRNADDWRYTANTATLHRSDGKSFAIEFGDVSPGLIGVFTNPDQAKMT